MKAIMILLSLTVMPVFAEPSPVTEMSAMQVITPLLLVIALIFLLAWLVKKVNPGQTTIGKDIMVISSTPVSNQARLCLVRVGGKDILVGVTAQQVTHIETFNEPTVDLPDNSSPHDLSQHFRKLMKRDNEK